MMKIIFNGNLIDTPAPLSLNDRGFQYGDGFFETMMVIGSEIPLFQYHMNRVSQGLDLLKLNMNITELQYLQENINTLIQVNDISTARVRTKLMIWRRATPGQGYMTNEHHANWMLMTFPYDRPFIRKDLRLGFSDDVRIHNNRWSGLKTLNALPYVMASLECDEKGLDDLILLTPEEYIGETIAANIFWSDGQQWYTPDTSTGCISGTMRRLLLDRVHPSPKEVLYTPQQLREAKYIITTNATGIGLVSELDGVPLEVSDELALEIEDQLIAQKKAGH